MTSSDMTLISIGMPVLNCAATLQQALMSLKTQTHTNWELWLLDDDSADDTLDIARRAADPRIHILSDGKQLGIAARLNQAIARSRGAYFARMDGDDIAYPQRLERQYAFLQAHQDIDLVGTAVLEFGRGGVPRGVRRPPTTHGQLCSNPALGFQIAHPTFTGRIEFFRRYGYRTYTVRTEDQDLLLRAYRHSQFANLPEILLGYRAERMLLRRRLGMRRSHLGSLFRESWRQHRADWFLVGAVSHLVKAGVETSAVGVGMGEWVLRKHCMPLTVTDEREWEHVWQGVS